MTEKEIVKVIKRVNERMAVYQRQGLTDSKYYNKMVDKIQLLNIPFSETKGRFKISLKKSDISQIRGEDLATLDNMQSLKDERKQAKEMGYKNTKEQNEYITNRGSFEKWADENLEKVYNDSKSGMKSAQDLEKVFKDGARKVDYGYLWELVARWEKEREEFHKELHTSTFYRDDIFGDK